MTLDTKEQWQYIRAKIVLSTNSVGTTGYLHAKKEIEIETLCPSQNWLKMYQNLSVKCSTLIKLPEENIEENRGDLEYGDEF